MQIELATLMKPLKFNRKLVVHATKMISEIIPLHLRNEAQLNFILSAH